MPRKLLRHFMPRSDQVHSHWLFRRLGTHFHHPRLWHLNRRSVSGATGIGLFIAFLPIPFQIVLVTLVAIGLRVNLPVSVAWVFVTNPLTMGPAFYLCYKLGAWLLGSPDLVTGDGFTPTVEWLITQLALIWQPLLAGSLVTGVATSLLGYCLIQLGWRAYVVYKRGHLLKRYGNH